MNTEQERAELLPCPFCGAGKTEVRENGRPWLGTKWGEPASVSVRHWCEPVDGQPSRMIERVGRDRAAAIAAWNRRAALPSQDREGALREALEVMVEMVEMNGFGRAYAMKVARAALAQKQEET